MADSKISALPASTTPLAGTEVLPIVQSNTTKQVSVDNLTAGRAISATSVTASTGNFVVGTSGQGIDFSATSGTGTSELFADYEEGNWTPVLVFGVGSTGITYGTQQGRYTKVGRTVTIRFEITLTSKGSSTGEASITGLPFAAANLNSMSVYLYSNFLLTYKVGIAYCNSTTINEIAANGTAAFSDTQFTNTSRFWATCTYQV
jgi:hypothetical protein